MMWDTPQEAWPPLVSFCVNLWRDLNPDYNVEIYDAARARELVKSDFDLEIYDTIKIQHQADILRTKLLAERGGIWVDATCMPHRPVRLWIDRFQDSDFAGLKTLTAGQTVDNWFMISKKCSILMQKQYQNLINYWKTPKIPLPQDARSISMIAERSLLFVSDAAAHDLRIAPYFLWQYLFTRLYETDAEFSEVFRRQTYSSADGGCGFVALALAKQSGSPLPLQEEIRKHVIYSSAPLSKLIRWNPQTIKILDELRTCVALRGEIEGFQLA
jgi:hypothetical protein